MPKHFATIHSPVFQYFNISNFELRFIKNSLELMNLCMGNKGVHLLKYFQERQLGQRACIWLDKATANLATI